MSNGRGLFNCTAMLNDMLDLYDCQHYGGANQMPHFFSSGDEGAIVVVHGGREIGGLEKLQRDIDQLNWCLLIFLGDEEASFPAELVQHENMIVWVQEPLPGKHDFAKRFMVNGYGHEHNRYLVKCEKDLDWFYGGQVTHERRRAVVDALRNVDWGGFIIETRGYHQGISLQEYYRCLCRAKVVPCPSGPFSPDAARIWDTLECGGIPILDDVSPARTEPGFWAYTLGEHPMPVVTDWSTLPALIESMKRENFERLAGECQVWWFHYLQGFTNWLLEDIEQLTGEPCTKISSR
jgi:hypothetical protein